MHYASILFVGPAPNVLHRIAGCPTPNALLCIAGCPTPNALFRVAGCPTSNVLMPECHTSMLGKIFRLNLPAENVLLLK